MYVSCIMSVISKGNDGDVKKSSTDHREPADGARRHGRSLPIPPEPASE